MTATTTTKTTAQIAADEIRAFQTAVHALDMLPASVELTRCGIKVVTGHCSTKH